MIVTFRIRRDTATNWTLSNPVLALGEPGLETDTRRVKYGDGETAWSNLLYASSAPVLPSPALIVSGTDTGQTVNAAFETLKMTAVDTDTSGGFDLATSTWAVPETGLYGISTKLRAPDGTPAGIIFGLGADVDNVDGPEFLWSRTNGAREGHQLYRLARLVAGTRLRAFAYSDPSIRVSTTSLTAIRLG